MRPLLDFLYLMSIPLSIVLIPAVVGGAFWLGRARPGRTISVLALLALISVVVIAALLWIDVVTIMNTEQGVGIQRALTPLLSDIGVFAEGCTLLAFGLGLYFSFQRRSWGWFIGMLAAFAYFVVLQQSLTEQALFLVLEYSLHFPIGAALEVFVVVSNSVLAVVTLIYGLRLEAVSRRGELHTEDTALQAAAQITDRASPGAV